jgi:hypothetical protein
VHEQLGAETDGKSCLESKCLTVLGREVCSPEVCVAAEALARITTLRGLASGRVLDAQCIDAVQDGCVHTHMHAARAM